MQLAIGTTLVFRFSTRALAFFSPQLKLSQLNLSAKPCETVAVVLICSYPLFLTFAGKGCASCEHHKWWEILPWKKFESKRWRLGIRLTLIDCCIEGHINYTNQLLSYPNIVSSGWHSWHSQCWAPRCSKWLWGYSCINAASESWAV